MGQTPELPAISILGPTPRDDFASRAPQVVANPAGILGGSAKFEPIEVSQLEIPRARPRRRLGLGAAASLVLHGAFILAALLRSQSEIERAPEPIAVEILVERAPDPAPPSPEPQPEAPQPPMTEVAAPADASLPLPPPPAVETPPTPEPTPTPVAVAEPPQPAAETPPPANPVAKIEPPKPAPAPKRAANAAPSKPRPAPKTTVARDAGAAEASAPRTALSASRVSLSVGEYRDAVAARIRAHQRFPEAAREAGAHGAAEVNFSLDDAGQVRSVTLVKSAGDAELDADAVATIRRSAPFGPPPPGAARAYQVPLRYNLQ